MHTWYHRQAFVKASSSPAKFAALFAYSAEHPSDDPRTLTEAGQDGINDVDATTLGLGHEGTEVHRT